jgi:hypothetical protein
MADAFLRGSFVGRTSWVVLSAASDPKVHCASGRFAPTIRSGLWIPMRARPTRKRPLKRTSWARCLRARRPRSRSIMSPAIGARRCFRRPPSTSTRCARRRRKCDRNRRANLSAGRSRSLQRDLDARPHSHPGHRRNRRRSPDGTAQRASRLGASPTRPHDADATVICRPARVPAPTSVSVDWKDHRRMSRLRCRSHHPAQARRLRRAEQYAMADDRRSLG